MTQEEISVGIIERNINEMKAENSLHRLIELEDDHSMMVEVYEDLRHIPYLLLSYFEGDKLLFEEKFPYELDYRAKMQLQDLLFSPEGITVLFAA